MSTSSAPKNLSTSLDDINTITLTSSPVLDSNMYSTYSTLTGLSTVTINPTYTASTISISDFHVDTSQFSFNFPVDWQDQFPDWNKVQDMCKNYPGLKIAFENLKVVYEMCKDDYDNPTPKK
jgi:hypothetical protein